MGNAIRKERIKELIEESEIKVYTVFDKVTVVALQLSSGFVIVESSGVVDKEKYDEDMGKKIALERIENRLWELEGYMLQTEMAMAEELMSLFDKQMDNNDSEEKKEEEDNTMYVMGHGNLNDGHTVSQGDKIKIVDSQGRVLYESSDSLGQFGAEEEVREDEDTGDTLVIWLKNGQTLYFNKVRDLWELSDRLAFTYFGMETQVRREANFKLDSIAGYAIEED